MSVRWKSVAQAAACAGVVAVCGLAPDVMKAQGRRGGGPNPLATTLFTAFDADKDGNVTGAEVKAAFDSWYDAADTQKTGKVTQDQLSAALGPVFGPPAAPAAAGGPGGRAGGAGGGRGATEFVAGASTPGLNDAC